MPRRPNRECQGPSPISALVIRRGGATVVMLPGSMTEIDHGPGMTTAYTIGQPAAPNKVPHLHYHSGYRPQSYPPQPIPQPFGPHHFAPPQFQQHRSPQYQLPQYQLPQYQLPQYPQHQYTPYSPHQPHHQQRGPGNDVNPFGRLAPTNALSNTEVATRSPIGVRLPLVLPASYAPQNFSDGQRRTSFQHSVRALGNVEEDGGGESWWRQSWNNDPEYGNHSDSDAWSTTANAGGMRTLVPKDTAGIKKSEPSEIVGFAGHRPPQGDSIPETSGFSGGSEAVAQHTTAVKSQLPRGIKRELNPEFLAPSAAMRLNSYQSNAYSSERGIDQGIPRVKRIKLEEVEDGPMPKRIKMEDQEHEITRGFKLEDDDQEIRDW